MKFLIDNQLPLLLADYLRQHGHDCVHVLEIHLDEADDAAIWAQAERDERIVVSKDDDFVFLANRPNQTGKLLWVRLGNCRNAALIAAFDRVQDELIRSFASGQRIIELR